jgi:hypothetical protein
MDVAGIELAAFSMRRKRDTTTPNALTLEFFIDGVFIQSEDDIGPNYRI